MLQRLLDIYKILLYAKCGLYKYICRVVFVYYNIYSSTLYFLRSRVAIINIAVAKQPFPHNSFQPTSEN